MDTYYVLNIILQVVLLSIIIISLIRFKRLDKASKYLSFYLIVTFLFEGYAIIHILREGNNTIVYNTYSIIQLSLLFLYYKSLLNHYFKIVLTIFLIGLAFFFTNAFVLQDHINELNTNFLALESVIIVFFSLLYFYSTLLSDNNANKIITVHFCFNSILLTFWSFTLTYWLVSLTIFEKLGENAKILNYMIWSINVIAYLGFGLVFLFYKRLQPARE